jgi:hypothetical protein
LLDLAKFWSALPAAASRSDAGVATRRGELLWIDADAAENR